MSGVDWIVLASFFAFIATYGVWRGRVNRDLAGYLLADRDLRWYTIALSIMATQASAITFLSTPGQAYVDGMRFVQFYFGLPLAMVVLCVTAVPIFHRLKVYTAYEFLEQRFDLKTRTLAGLLFLIQRGLACGLTIYAPALIVSVLLGWNMHLTILIVGAIVIVYTTSGGTKAVDHTNSFQMLIIFTGMFSAFAVIILRLPPEVSFLDAAYVAGKLGRMNAIDFSFDLKNRYNFWSGLIGGFFLALSYFGTDQSQVQRYLTGKSVAQSRLGLLFNGMVKIPMQFFILFIGAMVFAFYQFNAPPMFFNPGAAVEARAGSLGREFTATETEFQKSLLARSGAVNRLVAARRTGDHDAIDLAARELQLRDASTQQLRQRGIELMKRSGQRETNDTNYIFLTFIMNHLPHGLIGLVIAAIFAASMSSTASELNALAATTVVDLYKRMFKRDASDRHYVIFGKTATFIWGAFAIGFAEYANRLGSLVEAVNILGSLFYGTILGIFLLAFYVRRVGGTAAFSGALVGELAVISCYRYTDISFLWYNVVGCVVTIAFAMIIEETLRLGGSRRPAEQEA